MIRTLKKLKAWSRKRTKKRKRDLLDGTPPQRCACSCSCCSPIAAPQFQPPAPPLPPWLDYEPRREAVISDPAPATTPGVVFLPPFAEPPGRWLPPAGDGWEITPPYAVAPGGGIPSYQQYLAPDPVYGVPIARPAPSGRGSGAAGGCGGVEVWLRRCLCCCLGGSN